MFDTVCKFLVENFSLDFATWLLGNAIALTELSPSELSLEPIRADALILLQSSDTILHFFEHARAFAFRNPQSNSGSTRATATSSRQNITVVES